MASRAAFAGDRNYGWHGSIRLGPQLWLAGQPLPGTPAMASMGSLCLGPQLWMAQQPLPGTATVVSTAAIGWYGNALQGLWLAQHGSLGLEPQL